MTQGANVPACEAVSQILRETARLGLEPLPETLLTRAALSCERIYDSLIPLQTVKEPHRLRNALDTCITLCVGHAAARHQEPDATDRCRVAYPTFSRTRRLRLARPRCGVRVCADLGRSPLTFQGHFRMTNILRKWETGFANIRGQKRAIQQQGYSAPPRFRIDDSLISRLKVQELRRRGIALDTANTCAPSTPEAAVRNRISHPMRDISSCTTRARASFTSCPRALRCTDSGLFSPTLEGRFRTTDRREHGKQGSLISEGKGEPFSSRDIQRLPGCQRMSSRSSESMNNEHSSPPSKTQAASLLCANFQLRTLETL